MKILSRIANWFHNRDRNHHYVMPCYCVGPMYKCTQCRATSN